MAMTDTPLRIRGRKTKGKIFDDVKSKGPLQKTKYKLQKELLEYGGCSLEL